MSNRRTALAAAAGLIAGCGGGASGPGAVACQAPRPRIVSCWGDSTHSGGYAAAPGSTEVRYLRPRPSARIAQQLGDVAYACLEHSRSGSLVAEYTAAWPSTLEMDPAQVQVLRWGGADAVVGTAPAAFGAALAGLVAMSLQAGKRVVLVGVIHVAASKADWGWSEPTMRELDGKAALLDDQVRLVAERAGVAFVPLRGAVLFNGPGDIADAVHPAQAYSDRCADAIAAAVRPLLT